MGRIKKSLYFQNDMDKYNYLYKYVTVDLGTPAFVLFGNIRKKDGNLNKFRKLYSETTNVVHLQKLVDKYLYE